MARQRASEATTEAQPTTSATPNIKLRSQQTIHHHLFKGQVAQMKKNISFIPGSPKIMDVEHAHFFHSVNSVGVAEKYTNEVGGHFHEIEWGVNDKGELVAKCGPPLKRISKRGRDGQSVIKIVPIKWIDNHGDDKDEQDTEPKTIIDQHTHAMTYEGSDEISTQMINDSQKKLMPTVVPQGTPEAELVDNDR